MIPSTHRYSVQPFSNIAAAPRASERAPVSSAPSEMQRYVDQYVQKVLQEGRFGGFPESKEEYVRNQVGAHVRTEQYDYRMRTGRELPKAEVARIESAITASSTAEWIESAAKKAAEFAKAEYEKQYPQQASPLAFMPGNRHAANDLRARLPRQQVQESRSNPAFPSDEAIANAVKRREDRGHVFYRVQWRDPITGVRMERSRATGSRGEAAARKELEDLLRGKLRDGTAKMLGT